ncbi:MAG: hypothetical protein BZ137_00905 [Methanosphaera sp. rholeuAM130]|nr:hypothetical protein [Methanosphaera sp.]RAP54684.1 MAG: hypothetical protein BZ137_00905 [Methanosphaera sp. rholeuAM130]
MKYLTDSFSMKMFDNRTYKISTKKIKKSKLMANTKDAVTSIGSFKIAKMLRKQVGRKDIKLESGDEIYVITSRFGRNKSSYKKENTYRYQVFSIL